MAITTLNNRAINRSDTASSGQLWTATSATASDFQAVSAGKIGQVVQAVKTDRSTYGTASFADISGMTVNITPAATSSKILVMTDAFISVTSNYGAHIKLVRDSSDLYIGDAASNRSRASKGSVHYHGASGFSMSFMYLDSPSTTSQVTYKLQWYPEASSTIAIGGTQNDGDAVYVSRTANSITVMEVLA